MIKDFPWEVQSGKVYTLYAVEAQVLYWVVIEYPSVLLPLGRSIATQNRTPCLWLVQADSLLLVARRDLSNKPA